jgi:hypothetical protein
MDDLIEAMARAILKTRWYDCEPCSYPSLESFWIEIDPDHWIDARDEARAALAAINARGDRVVPGVATPAMAASGGTVLNNFCTFDPESDADSAYTAMLAASPYTLEGTT